jgi:signal transduction histidine kinase
MTHLPRANPLSRSHSVPDPDMPRLKKLPRDVTAELRHLAHDLSNSIETIMQAGYLLAQTKLDSNGRRWAKMIESAVDDAARINRGIREILRNEQEKAHDKASGKRRAS